MYKQIIQITEAALETLNINASNAKIDEGQYNIRKNDDIELLIDVWEENDSVFFQVISPLTHFEKDLDYQTLLKLLKENHGLIEASISISDNTVLIKETISCNAFFNQEKALSSITRIAHYSGNLKSNFR